MRVASAAISIELAALFYITVMCSFRIIAYLYPVLESPY